MRGADRSTIISVEIFMKVKVVSKMWIALQSLVLAKDGPAALFVPCKDSQQTVAQFRGDLVNG
jgi:hypothetical protein